ncbi:MAG: class B sortase [Oscillospiraceae bacterium]|nr:class B sortase [Oscillospiraceae bacterium]
MGKRIEKRNRQQGWKRAVPVAIFLAGLLMVVFASTVLWQDWRDDVSARNEYAALRTSFDRQFERPIAQPSEPRPPGISPDERPHDTRIDMSHFSAINPDFVGWISIAGTSVSYPIVQADDNVVYLDTTFSGERNPAGAIFMDFRTLETFAAPLTMLHGHNMRDGSMFAPLMDYLDPAFLDEHREITIVTADGEILVYEVFHVRWTNAWDRVYLLDPNEPATAAVFAAAPEGSQVLLLSTCASDGDRNERLLVYAARIHSADGETGA